MDAIEKLAYYKTHELPKTEEERASFIEELIRFPHFYIYYEDVCAYIPSFKEQYSEDVLKNLFRKYQIIGKNVAKEINLCSANKEEKMLMRFFFKGRVDNIWQ